MTTTVPPRRRWWQHPAVRITGSAVVLFALFLALPADMILHTLAGVPVWIWPTTIAGYLALHLLGVTKWRILVNLTGGGIPFPLAARAYYLGLFGNIFLPSLVGGDLVRAGVAFGPARSRAGLVLGSIADRALDLLGLTLIAGIGLLLAPQALNPVSRGIFAGVTTVLGAGTVAALILIFLVTRRTRGWRRHPRLIQGRRAFRRLWRQPTLLVLTLCMGMALQASLIMLAAWLGTRAGITVPLHVWLFVWPLAKMSALAPITQGGIGVREAAQAVLFAPFGVSAALAVAAGLMFQVVVIGGGIVAGLLGWYLGGKSLRPNQAIHSVRVEAPGE